MNSLRFKFGVLIALLALLTIAPVGMAWKALQDSLFYGERSRQAHAVLDVHLALAERGHRLLRHLDHDGGTGEPLALKLTQDIRLYGTRARRLIAEEVQLIGEEGLAEEGEEIDRIDAIMTSLDRATMGLDDDRWQGLIDAAVTDEQSEVAEVDAEAARAFSALGGTLAVTLAGTLLVIGLTLLWFRSSLLVPISRLIGGMKALAGGEHGTRISPTGDREFRDLARNFNEMAARLQLASNSLESDKDTLEFLVEERTSEMAKLNSELKSAADRRNQFLADISHELRTPLAIIRGEAEVTLRGKAKEAQEYQASLSIVADQVAGMSRLVDDLLYVARTEAGAPKMKMRPVNLIKIAETAARQLRALIESDDGTIVFSSEAPHGSVLGDADRLAQLLRILLDNAIQYSEGSPHIAISVILNDEGFILTVSDKGVGIEADDLANVFDRFHRGRLSSKQNTSGMGIGLPMAKAIVEGHGGSIKIDSKIDDGTSVSVFLPGVEGVRAAT
jgi:two-component system, OmpR family, sensor kinase